MKLRMTGEAAPELDKQEDRRGIALTRQQQVADDRRQPSGTRQWTAGSGGSGSGGLGAAGAGGE